MASCDRVSDHVREALKGGLPLTITMITDIVAPLLSPEQCVRRYMIWARNKDIPSLHSLSQKELCRRGARLRVVAALAELSRKGIVVRVGNPRAFGVRYQAVTTD